MDISFGEALLIFGSLLAVTAALSGLIRGTVLSASVLSIALGIVLAELDVVSVDVGDAGDRRADRAGADPDPGLRRAARRSRAARAPLGPAGAGAGVRDADHPGPARARARSCSSAISTWAEAFLLGAVLCADRPGRHLVGGHLASACPPSIRHTLNLESGLNDGLALPFVLFFLVLASPGGDAGQRGRRAGRRGRLRRRDRDRARGRSAGWLHRVVPRRRHRRATRGSTRSASGSPPSGSPTSPSATA